jgi:copper chaperone CopZ
MSKFVLLFLAIAGFSFAVSAQHHHDDGHNHEGEKLDAVLPSVVKPAGGDIIKVDVNGLVCDFCAQAINKVFRKQKSVADISVDLREKLIVVALKKDGQMDNKRLSKLIRDSGYDVVNITRFEPDEAS